MMLSSENVQGREAGIGLECLWTHFTDCSTFLSVSRHLAGEVAKEWQEVEENDKTQQETLLKLVKEIVPYNMAHNAEHEACDLLMEIERLDMLEDYIDENAYGKVCLYLTRYVQVWDFAQKMQTLLLSMLYTGNTKHKLAYLSSKCNYSVIIM